MKEVKMAEKWKEAAEIVSQERIGDQIFSMWLQTEKIAKAACPGQFVSLYTKDGSKLLPRPISICETEKEKGQLRIVYRVTGEHTGTELFSRMEEGETVDILGPLGNGFPLEAGEGKRVLLAGGGIGVPPMLELAKQLKAEKLLVMGYRDKRFLEEELQENGTLFVSTEDGSFGVRGNVLDVIREKQLEADVIYACGPLPMLRALKAYAQEKEIPCYISLEERMACGIGACLGCVCKTKEIDAHSHVHNARICKDGPVFLASEVEI